MSAPTPEDAVGAASGAAPAAGAATDANFLGDRYELGELLGRGGMADVRIGIDRRLGRRVAVKQLRWDLSRDPTFQARFRREAQSAASLNHPSIVAVYDTGEHADATGAVVPYIVMEHVEGETLRDLLRSGRKLMPERALEITAEVLSALDYSHRAGIVHRDIKPANVMLTPSGRAKVMDFGIARSVSDASATLTQTAAVVGTAQYLSPEQARGEAADARSDLYSTGCLLFELLAGRPPFQGDSPVAVAYQHVREDPPAPSTFNPEVTPAMDAIAARALQKKTSERYQSAAQMRADIERALAGQDVAAPAAGSEATSVTLMAPAVGGPVASPTSTTTGGVTPAGQPPQRPRRRWRWWLLLALLGVLLAIGAAFLVPWLLDDSPPADTPVPDLLGQTLPQAQLALDRAGLTVDQIERRNSDEPAGTVIGQDPEPDTLVVADSQVDLVVSAGAAQVQVPYVLGQSRREAITSLRDYGLEAEVTFEDSDQPQGTVLATKPEPTTMVDPESTVELIVSAGPVKVPEVRGLSESAAVASLAEAGFGYQVVEDPGSDQPAGVVVAQTPEPGTRATSGSTVIITVSTQPVATTPPPTTEPTTQPTTQPTTEPTTAPTTEPTTQPTTQPTTAPTTKPPKPPKPDGG